MPSAHADSTPRLSAIIPTLGGDALERTIGALNGGTVVPDEIVVCIPEHEAQGLRPLPWSNVRVLATPCRGQVAQRAVGFSKAAHPLVLQLDDDLIVAEDCVERLREALMRFGHTYAVSPALIDSATGQSVYRTPEQSSWVDRMQFRLLNGRDGYQPGSVHRTGAAVGVDPLSGDREFHDVEWLPGGCVLHHRDNLVLENFYPFAGKAYCEDIIHSFHLASRGIHLRVVSAARCSVDVPRGPQTVREFARDLTADLRARRYYMRLSSRTPAQVYVFGLARCLAYLAERTRHLAGDRS